MPSEATNTFDLAERFFGDAPEAWGHRVWALVAIAIAVAVFWALLFRGSWDPYQRQRRSFAVRIARRLPVMLIVAVLAHFQINSILDVKQRQFKLVEDTLYLPSADTVSLVAMGYDELLSDVLFLRAIQAYGGGWQFTGKGGRPKLFEHYINVTTDLDPHFTRAYTFGNLLVGEEMRSPATGLGILEKGKFLNPDEYRVAYEGGFFSVDRLDDYERGAHYLRWAVHASDCPDWVERQIYFFSIKQGQFEIGYKNYLRMLLEAKRSGNWVEEHIAEGRLEETMDDWSLDIIRKAVRAYKDARGQYPEKLGELVAGHFIEPYTIYHTGVLNAPDERLGGLSLLEAVAQGTESVDDKLAKLLGAIAVSSSELPPSHDGSDWFYQRTGDSFHLERITQGLLATGRAIQIYHDIVIKSLTETGMTPPSLQAVLESVSSDPAEQSIPDPQGTFILYNPATSDVNYWSTYVGVW